MIRVMELRDADVVVVVVGGDMKMKFGRWW